MPADHGWRTNTGANEMKQNERGVWKNYGMKFVAEEIGRKPEETYPDSVSSTTKAAKWSD